MSPFICVVCIPACECVRCFLWGYLARDSFRALAFVIRALPCSDLSTL